MCPAGLRGEVLCARASPELEESDVPSLTTTHQIFSEERAPEPKWEHVKIRGEAGEQLLELRVICTKISKGSNHKNSMGVKAKYIVATWIQTLSFDELGHIHVEIKNKLNIP